MNIVSPAEKDIGTEESMMMKMRRRIMMEKMK